MEDWMHYERVRRDLFQQPGAYAFPFGSTRLGWLYEASDAELRRLSLPRLRDRRSVSTWSLSTLRGSIWRSGRSPSIRA
jgi:hypothetical protein